MKNKKLNRLEILLQSKSFESCVKDGDIFDVKTAAQRSGYSEQHIRRLCHENRIPHFSRGVEDLKGGRSEVWYFFFPEDLAELFSFHSARSSK